MMAGPLLLLLALGWLMRLARELGADPGSDALLAFGYLVLTSVLAGKIAERIGLAKPVGYLLVGFVAGPLGLGLVTEHAASSLGLVGDTAIGLIALGVGCQANVARVRASSPPVRACVLCAVLALGTAAGMLVAGFSRVTRRGAAAFAVVVCVAVAILGARVQPAPLLVMLASGVWLASFAPASAGLLADQLARVRLPLALVWCAVAGARLH